MSTNKHIVEVTIIWPDDQWGGSKLENQYLVGCLIGVQEFFEKNPIERRDKKLTLTNRLGRTYAEIEVNVCKLERETQS